MLFANVNTKEIRSYLDSVLVLNGFTVQGANITHWAQLGWRQVVNQQVPSAGFRVTEWNIVQTSGTTCDLTIKTQVDIAAEQAATDAAITASDKDGAKVVAELSKDPTGRALRAVAALVLLEINTLRTKAGLATYTGAQFLNAIKAKIDEQT